MTPANDKWYDRLWGVAKSHFPLLEGLVTVFPKLVRFRLLLLVITVVLLAGVSQWDSISRLGFVAGMLDNFKMKSLPEASPRQFSVAVAHIEADQNNDVEKLVTESLKGIRGIDLLRFDRTSGILAADRPLDAEKEAHAQARTWLRSGGADLVIWGYLLPTKERTVRLFITPRLTEETFEARMPAEQSLDFPVKAGQALAGAVEAQVLAHLAQFDPGRDVARDLTVSVVKLSGLIEHWPPGREKAAMQVALGSAYRDLSVQLGDMHYLKQAVGEYRNALPEYRKEEDLIDRTMVRNFLGGALRLLGDGDIRYVHEAVQVYRDSLREIRRKDTPAMWASVQSNLGIALHVIGSAEQNADVLRLAVAAHGRALAEVTQDEDGLNWGLMQASLGNSLISLGHTTGEHARYGESLAAYENALLELTRDRYPLYWAMIKSNEGSAQMSMASALKNEKGLVNAGQTFSDALQEYTREKVPVRFGAVKHNLALVAYARYQLMGDPQRLEEAVRLLKVALETRTADRARIGWAESQYTLGMVLIDLAVHTLDDETLHDAGTAFRNAATVFDEKNYPQRANDLAHRLSRLPKLREVVRSANSCLQVGQGRDDAPACERLLGKGTVY